MNQMISNLPSLVAGNQEDYRRLFESGGDWEKCKGLPIVHILIKDIHDSMLVTRNGLIKSNETIDLETELISLLRNTIENCSLNRAISIMHRLYIPTDEEYERLKQRELFGADEDNSYIDGEYDSVPEKDKGWFNFALQRWNEYHEAQEDVKKKEQETKREEFQDVPDGMTEKDLRKNLNRGDNELFKTEDVEDDSNDQGSITNDTDDQEVEIQPKRKRGRQKGVLKEYAEKIKAEWDAMSPEEQRGWSRV